MLRSSGPPAKPDIKRVIDEILKEDAKYDQSENRSAHRENLVRFVGIEFRQAENSQSSSDNEDSEDETESPSGFSRNVSATGIGLITEFEINDKSVAVLSIERLGTDSKPITILSECRWCRPYGNNWFLSGWQFLSLKR